jgi:chromosome segregation ATPase
VSIELINKVAELAAEIGKAQLILESKDEQIGKMDEFIGEQNKQMEQMNNQLNELNAMNQNLQAQVKQMREPIDVPQPD